MHYFIHYKRQFSEMVDSLRFLALNESCEDEENCGSSQHGAHYQVVLPVVFLLVHLQIDLLTHTDHLPLLLLPHRPIRGRPTGSAMSSCSKQRNCPQYPALNLSIEQTYVPSCSLFT